MIQQARIRRDEAIEQMLRFETYPGFSDDQFEREEIIRAFGEASKTAGRAKLIGDKLKRTMHFAPKVADIWEAAMMVDQELMQPKPFEPGLESRCNACGDTGWILRPSDTTAKRCACVGGKHA